MKRGWLFGVGTSLLQNSIIYGVSWDLTVLGTVGSVFLLAAERVENSRLNGYVPVMAYSPIMLFCSRLSYWPTGYAK